MVKKYLVFGLTLLSLLIGVTIFQSISFGQWNKKYCNKTEKICVTPLLRNSDVFSGVYLDVYRGRYFYPILKPLTKSWIKFKDANELVFDQKGEVLVIYVNGGFQMMYNNSDEKYISIVEVSGDPCSFPNKEKYHYSLSARCSFGDFHD